MKKIIWMLFFMLFAQSSLAAIACEEPFEPTRYSILGYYGRITRNTLGQVVGMNFSLDQEQLYSVEFSRFFSSESGIRRFFGPLVTRIALTGNITYHDDPNFGAIYEIEPSIYGAWHLFTLCNLISTDIALGEGPSYLTKTPTREHRNSRDPKKLLNYLMFELVLSSPQLTHFELVGRIHHRSGVFGLYHATNSGSTAVGVALRYYF